ncbi:MAG: 30S ribosomal protein S17 [Verrucomicrobiota bacterium]
MSEVKKESVEEKKSSRKERIGEVVSTKMQKTCVVKVTRRVPHPRFKKIVKMSSKFYVHDEKEAAAKGDRVKIIETPPKSKSKRWELAEILKH